MDSTYNHKNHEANIYKLWEESGAFNPDTQKNVNSSKRPFTILLPPPNANASLHAGHAMFVIEDILIRWHRMMGDPTVWIPGTDHAGFETQYVYEKHLSKAGKSRFQFDRQTLYNDIYQFVQDNSGTIFNQLKQLGFSCDWSRATFMLDEKVIKVVYDTFQHMIDDGLIYRDNYIVNYSPKNGTTFSELEVMHVERIDPLYYINIADKGSHTHDLVVATVRPETIFYDEAIAINPNDGRYNDWKDTTEVIFNGPLGSQQMRIIWDDSIDMEFGTGVMKVTPAHDANDFALGRKHNLRVRPLIDFFGKIDLSAFSPNSPTQTERVQKYHGKKVAQVRKLVAADMSADGTIVKVDETYTHNVTVDYKTGGDIEPMVMPNWFVKMKPLAQKGIAAAKNKDVTFVPSRFETQYYQWLENIRDWPISRQIVWGIRIPVWYSINENPHLEVTFLDENHERVIGRVADLLDQYELNTIRAGLQTLRAPVDAVYRVSNECPGDDYLPETDTFDTWFSSGQWPLTTLGFPDSADFKRFFPTQVLDTMWDILFFWVARMIMLSLYRTNTVPFETVYLHSMVTDEKGAKMSKSKGNVINPIDLTEKYGADALRIALIAGSAPGNPIALSENKVKGYRNFANKLWNIARFIVLLSQNEEIRDKSYELRKKLKENSLPLTSYLLPLLPEDQQILNELNTLIETSTSNLEHFRFSDYAQNLYDFIWNRVASDYLESTKGREDKEVVLAVLIHVFSTCLKLLHPVMPFVTEAIWQEWSAAGILETEQLLITISWPNVKLHHQ
ncbi:valine--tRNA ligase [Candidatus Cerribacteria bacterium 'Amazon FNV 2010 28 9']|uniref:Valine--tRNA ligase n=1 Tax=Candidatus Cerribacteria bacterium 'Amazon FNV 2010 28 9' TaxID=2081795 RepID=A0A317JQ23_9BACT|nr:MAG: valine--tRNA ligase [Candidatus Cerribacteria bacterium 'Amazon FNV 2010 28 9']